MLIKSIIPFGRLTVGASFLVLAACASTVEAPPPVFERAAGSANPVFARPAPVASVRGSRISQDVNAPIPGTVSDFIYRAGDDRVYFDYDRYDLSSKARSVLRQQAEWLNRYPVVNIVVAGNADERGTREYNLALGARRADSVKAYLVSLGVAPRRLTTVSFGKERPVDGRSNAAGWARNRNSHSNITSGAVG